MEFGSTGDPDALSPIKQSINFVNDALTELSHHISMLEKRLQTVILKPSPETPNSPKEMRIGKTPLESEILALVGHIDMEKDRITDLVNRLQI